MSLPLKYQHTFTPQEIQFITESTKIKVYPRITTANTKDPWNLITTDDTINKMRTMQSVELPLWLALILREQDKCNIIPPSWLSVESLTEFYNTEQANILQFSALPWNWLTIAHILLQKCPQDFNDPIHILKGLVQDLREVRMLKVKNGLKEINESHLQLDNLSLMEINELRPFIAGVMDKMRDLHESVQDGPAGEEY